jgi:N-acetylglucosamine-6-phosphate deacetylase
MFILKKKTILSIQISNVSLDASRSSSVTISGVHLEEPWMTNKRLFSNNNKNRIDENEEMVDCIDLKNEEMYINARCGQLA